MMPDDFFIGMAEAVAFGFSFVSMIVFSVILRKHPVRRDSPLILTAIWVALLAYGLALIFTVFVPKDSDGRQMPSWFPFTFRALLGLSLTALVVLTFQKGLKASQRWVSLTVALVIGWLIYLSLQHGDLTMS